MTACSRVNRLPVADRVRVIDGVLMLGVTTVGPHSYQALKQSYKKDRTCYRVRCQYNNRRISLYKCIFTYLTQQDVTNRINSVSFPVVSRLSDALRTATDPQSLLTSIFFDRVGCRSFSKPHIATEILCIFWTILHL